MHHSIIMQPSFDLVACPRVARDLGTTVGEAVAIATRRRRQQRIGRDLSTPLSEDETSWLDADLG